LSSIIEFAEDDRLKSPRFPTGIDQTQILSETEGELHGTKDESWDLRMVQESGGSSVVTFDPEVLFEKRIPQRPSSKRLIH
jgi:hypothetical protein